MTVKNFSELSGFSPLALPCPDKEIDGVYVGDLLSWVMGRMESGNLWITIMSNVNVFAVASLKDASSVILAEGVTLEDEVLKVALDKEINVLSSDKTAYEIALICEKILK